MIETINAFSEKPLASAASDLFKALNIPINELNIEGGINDFVLPEITIKQTDKIGQVTLLGSVDDKVFENEKSEFNYLKVMQESQKYDGLILFTIELNEDKPTRSFLAEVTRGLNRSFHTSPVVVIFKYGDYISLANTERVAYQQKWREGEKVGKVSLLKDIYLLNPHRGHVNIIKSIAITDRGEYAVKNYSDLYYYWQSTLSISILNKRFYTDVINWFNLAVNKIKIPDAPKGSEKHKDFVVRLIARLIFIWFLKELRVVKEELLIPIDETGSLNSLITPSKAGSSYYKFVLQNLFFNALNTEKKDREFVYKDEYGSTFSSPKEILDKIDYSPFLNGGLFDIHKNDHLNATLNNAFSIPDELFLHAKNGILNILLRYKFTIAENTPLEEEIAVDPEMLGRIFENLLAEQSDDTAEVARKNAGAFYTPRPVVSYMCKSALLRHIGMEVSPENAKPIIHKLLNTTVLDPACGSGAYPMGMLEEMMVILEKVDPDGRIWISEMLKSKDSDFLAHISDFVADNQVRYVKKLGLLKNCLFGIDLLEYAVEITKLRCWLSLIVEQRVDFRRDNFNLKPLPNLEFKFYKKNSLLRYFKDQNINQLLDTVDSEGLLKKLHDLENEYFITTSSQYGSKDEIKSKISALLEKSVQKIIDALEMQYQAAQSDLNKLISAQETSENIKRQKNKVKKLVIAKAEALKRKEMIKDYFVERVVFPGIFNKSKDNPGFDIVIGNPPYVNTKLINSMGLTDVMKEEYGYCDDLYNHFTVRGLELLKKGGTLSYITSDTFLTLQTKKNMRRIMLCIPEVSKKGDGFFAEEVTHYPESHVLEIINTPKAFAALVDTAIFSISKEAKKEPFDMVYVDLRKPDEVTFGITKEEWEKVKQSKRDISGWERVLDHTFTALGYDQPNWIQSHSCNGVPVYEDKNSSLLKFKLSNQPYREAINFAIFSPTPYNCQILEKIIKPARPVFDQWWSKIETSREIEKNRVKIAKYTSRLNSGEISLIGVLTDGGQGLATGNNGQFVGYKSSSRFAAQCIKKRIEKLYEVLFKHPELKEKWPLLSDVNSKDDVAKVLSRLDETEIWQLFDEIKDEYGLRIFGKGFMYRVIPPEFEFDVDRITDEQKTNGISGSTCWVPYDKGDREGNRWYLETPYLVDWSQETVRFLSHDSRARWQGYNFFFRNGFCWTNVLNPNSVYFKCRLKDKTVNDVGSMALYDEVGLGDEYFVISLNSLLHFKVLREFLNGTVNVQMNDIRKIPIIIPTEEELTKSKDLFDDCLKIQQKYFAGEYTKAEARALLKPIEKQVDEFVNKLYGITAEMENITEDI